ncbi:MAG: AAA family ATPase [Candidatus Latescibacteria bacterium]|nr:AAA family ATPase [Candidatus Latescibacterota bacterium]
MAARTIQTRGPITDPEESIYVERPVDEEVLELVQRGNYVTVLGARQTGKTSLLYHLRRRLPADFYVSVAIDLTPVKDAEREQLYRFVGGRIAGALALQPEQRQVVERITEPIGFLEALKTMAGSAGTKWIVVTLDEFEAVPESLREGFFGTIRTVYNERSIQLEFERFVFVLAGATDPRTLISPESGLSPFNISQEVYSTDFDVEGVRQMVQTLQRGAAQEGRLAAAIYSWTQGHPNLTARLCAMLAAEPKLQVDEAAERLISGGDDNIQRVVGGLERFAEGPQWLQALVGEGKKPRYDRTSSVVAQLDLLGAIRRGDDGLCLIRNKLLEEALQRTGGQEVGAREEDQEAAVVDGGSSLADVHQVEPLPRGTHPYPHIIGQSHTMRRVFALMQKAASSDISVLVYGETGTGKEQVAQTIHRESERAAAPFIPINCGALTENLLESELFGHKKGAYTGASNDRKGLFEAAQGGTLFLDEIGETTPATQVKLLRVLQEGEIRRVGEEHPRPVDVRVICATNRDLEGEMAAGRFRADLFYRLYVMVIPLPPLRQRRGDIPLLVEHFLADYPTGLAPAALEVLKAYGWPGNIRELENQLASARAMAGGKALEASHLWGRLQAGGGEGMEIDLDKDQTLRKAREEFERTLLQRKLEQEDWQMGVVAKDLGLSRSRLYELIRKYDLKER